MALVLSAVVISASALEIDIPPTLQDKVALSIRDARDGSVVYQYRGTTPMLLASNMKVVTSYVALNSLGENFTWQTKLAYSGTIKAGSLNGDLYLIGGGDPRLSTQDVVQLFSRLKNLQINKINGNLM
jgi:D-alanyl-D-alanine carboxypeptidase/D-alanyl-D-alanine-endopeptidase (penicillin-binding protein 4)